MPFLAAIPWDLIGVLGGAFCCGSLFLFLAGTLGVIIYRSQTKNPIDANAPPRPRLPAESPETRSMLLSVVGYQESHTHARVRERWGRPITYTRTPTDGAHWFTIASGSELELTERNGRPGGVLTGDSVLDDRFLLKTEEPSLAPMLADPDLRDRLLSLPRVHLVSDGRAVTFVDDRLATLQQMCSPYDVESAEGRAKQVLMHDAVADVLVLVADRIT
ncbi:MAG: hypothetical protein CL927_15745 [Deltaproteobacteria bacterium]|nr:hypothetical protein [Deltaproteobacteria bacterium]HCH64155.1 hypothetical protein [Deltaproteobacteria bacterium]